MKAALDACREAAESGDSDRYYYANERFHDLIYEASHNAYLEQEARQLQSRLKPYRRLQLRVRNRMRRSLEEHTAVVAAITDGDEAGAEAALKSHVIIQGERFGDLVSSMRALKDGQGAA